MPENEKGAKKSAFQNLFFQYYTSSKLALVFPNADNK